MTDKLKKDITESKPLPSSSYHDLSKTQLKIEDGEFLRVIYALFGDGTDFLVYPGARYNIRSYKYMTCTTVICRISNCSRQPKNSYDDLETYLMPSRILTIYHDDILVVGLFWEFEGNKFKSYKYEQ